MVRAVFADMLYIGRLVIAHPVIGVLIGFRKHGHFIGLSSILKEIGKKARLSLFCTEI
jgi:hypothetical protein